MRGYKNIDNILSKTKTFHPEKSIIDKSENPNKIELKFTKIYNNRIHLKTLMCAVQCCLKLHFFLLFVVQNFQLIYYSEYFYK